MPDPETLERAERDKQEGKAPSTQAGEFVREEIHHIREGKHGARSTKQAIAIGLSKARRAGVHLDTPKRGTVPEAARRQAARDNAKGRSGAAVSPARSRGARKALKRASHATATSAALARQARSVARKRTPAQRSAAARRAARTRGRQGR